MTLTELVYLVRQRLWLIVGMAVTTGVVFFLAGQLLIQYEARATALIRPKGAITPDTLNIQLTGLVFSNQIDLISKVGQSYTQLIGQRELIGKTIERLGWEDKIKKNTEVLEFVKQPLRLLLYGRTPSEQTPVERLIDRTKNSIKSGFVGQSSVLEIRAKNRNAEQAAALANGLLETFISYSKERRHEIIQEYKKLLSVELKKCQVNLQERQNKLHVMAKALGLPVFADIDDARNRIQNKLQLLENEQEQRRYEKPLLDFQRQQTETQLERFPEFRRESFEKQRNTMIDMLKTQLLNLYLDKQQILLNYPDENIQVQSIKNRIALVQAQLEDELNSQLSKEIFKLDQRHQELLTKKFTLETTIELNDAIEKAAKIQIQKFNEQLIAFESMTMDWRALKNEIAQFQVYEIKLITQLTQISALGDTDLNEVEVLDRATVPRYPAIRNVPLVFFALLGFFLGGSFATAVFVWRSEISLTDPNESRDENSK